MLRVTSVCRSFGATRVLDEVTFDVEPGRITGFIGANGAGKTTTMRIILGVLAADSGAITWHGDPLTRAHRRVFGYMPEERGLYPKMKVREQLVYLGRLHGMSMVDARATVDGLLERLGLAGHHDAVLDTLSLGNQQRAQIAAALIHNPPLLVLDEPFSGLDPNAVDVMAEVLRDRVTRDVAVLFSSHQLELVERICDDLVIIAGGVIRAAGSRADLRAKYAVPRYELVADTDTGWLRDQPGVSLIDLDGGRAVFDLTDAAGTATDQSILAAALARGPVRRFGPVTPSLAEIFREVTH